jgi:hypothetical protein
MIVDHDFRDVRRVEQILYRRERLEKHIDSARLQRLQLQDWVIVKVGHARFSGRSNMRLLLWLPLSLRRQKGGEIKRLSPRRFPKVVEDGPRGATVDRPVSGAFTALQPLRRKAPEKHIAFDLHRCAYPDNPRAVNEKTRHKAGFVR